jgi:hypothetical protein
VILEVRLRDLAVEEEGLRFRVLLMVEQDQARGQARQTRGRARRMLRGEVAQGVRGLRRAGHRPDR